MARVSPPNRLDEVAEAAVRVFIEHGYRRAQMEDVAQLAGIAKGTLYLYVESKEALLYLALRRSVGLPPREEGTPLPLRAPATGELAQFAQRELRTRARLTSLERALARRRVPDAASELEEIVREIYHTLFANRRAIKLIDRVSVDYPTLGAIWYQHGRGGLLSALEQYLAKRRRRNLLRPLPDIHVAARFLVETLATWAVHIHWDPHPQTLADDAAEHTIVTFVLRALLPEAP